MTEGKGTLVTAFLIGLCFAYPSFASAQQPILWGSLKRGSYDVGFRSSVVFDSSRAVKEAKGPRPIQISIWYPAQSRSSAKKINYRDYFLLSIKEQGGDPLTNEQAEESVESYKKLLAQNGVGSKAADEWFGAACASALNAHSAKGRFPVVLVAQGLFHSAHHQAVLCEFIASYGFIVMATPSQARISGPMTSEDDVVPHAEAQAQDLLFALASLERDPNADIQSIGLVAHSFGARSAFLLALRDSRMKALVSLDGGIANRLGKAWIQKVPDFQPSTFRTPILHFYQDADSTVVPDFELLESLTGSPRTLVKMSGMRHFYFSSIGMATAVIPGFSPTRGDGLSMQWEAMANSTTDFLRAQVLGDRQALARIEALGAAGKSDENISAKKIPPRKAK